MPCYPRERLEAARAARRSRGVCCFRAGVRRREEFGGEVDWEGREGDEASALLSAGSIVHALYKDTRNREP